jgi:hypothetical protein
VTQQDILDWAREIADYLQKHPVSTRTLEERIWGLVGVRFNQEELDRLIEHVEQKLSR